MTKSALNCHCGAQYPYEYDESKENDPWVQQMNIAISLHGWGKIQMPNDSMLLVCKSCYEAHLVKELSKPVITKADYMKNSSELYHTYYMQFVNRMRGACAVFCEGNGYTKDYLKKCYDRDIHLNNLGGKWLARMDMWADAYKYTIAKINKEINGVESFGLYYGACILKAYMVDIIKD